MTYGIVMFQNVILAFWNFRFEMNIQFSLTAQFTLTHAPFRIQKIPRHEMKYNIKTLSLLKNLLNRVLYLFHVLMLPYRLPHIMNSGKHILSHLSKLNLFSAEKRWKENVKTIHLEKKDYKSFTTNTISVRKLFRKFIMLPNANKVRWIMQIQYLRLQTCSHMEWTLFRSIEMWSLLVFFFLF